MKKKCLFKLTPFIFLVIVITFPLIYALPIYVKPLKDNGELYPNTMFNYTFNFTSNLDCSGVILTNESTITTDSNGVGFIDINISTINSTAKYLCEYRNWTLRKTHSFSDIIFNTLWVKEIYLNESDKLLFSDNASMFYNGTDMIITPQKVGTGRMYFGNASIGIGTAAPQRTLHVVNADYGEVYLKSTLAAGYGGFLAYNDAGTGAIFGVGGSTHPDWAGETVIYSVGGQDIAIEPNGGSVYTRGTPSGTGAQHAVFRIDGETPPANGALFGILSDDSPRFLIDEDGDFSAMSDYGQLRIITGFVGWNWLASYYGQGLYISGTSSDPLTFKVLAGFGSRASETLTANLSQDTILFKRGVNGDDSTYSEAGSVVRIERQIVNVSEENGNFLEWGTNTVEYGAFHSDGDTSFSGDMIIGAAIGTDPTYPLTVIGNTSGISIWSDGNVSATDYITRTSVYDKNKGKALKKVKDADDYKDNGEINHSIFYGYTGKVNVTDFSKPVKENKIIEICINDTVKELVNITDIVCDYEQVGQYYQKICNNVTTEIERDKEDCNNYQEEQCDYIPTFINNNFVGYDRNCSNFEVQNCTLHLEESCINHTQIITTYPFYKEEEGVSLNMEIDVLRQAIFELKECATNSVNWIEYKECINEV